MDKDIPEIELSLTSSIVNPNRRKLKSEWTCEISDWSMFIDGIHRCAWWSNYKTGEHIFVDFDTAVLSLGDKEAAEELRKLLPNDG